MTFQSHLNYPHNPHQFYYQLAKPPTYRAIQNKLHAFTEKNDDIYKACTVYLICDLESAGSVLTICTSSESLLPKLSSVPFKSHLGAAV